MSEQLYRRCTDSYHDVERGPMFPHSLVVGRIATDVGCSWDNCVKDHENDQWPVCPVCRGWVPRFVPVEPDYEAATAALFDFERMAGTAPLQDDGTLTKWAKVIVDAALKGGSDE